MKDWAKLSQAQGVELSNVAVVNSKQVPKAGGRE